MLDRVETAHRLANRLRRNSGQPRRAYRRQHILDIVLAFQRNLAYRQNRFERWTVPRRARRSTPWCTNAPCRTGLRAAEPEDLSAWARLAACCDSRIVGVQHQKVLGGLVREDALLGGSVIFEGAMAVKMVRRDVQEHCDLGVKIYDGFQLEAGDFEHIPAVHRVLRRHQRDDRQPDIAADLRRQTAGCEDFARKARWWWSCRSSR